MPLNETYTLTMLLPSTPYLLAYSLPLLFLSLLLNFAGAFLTLDRSHSFPPRYDNIPSAFDQPNRTKFNWLLEGGIGGLAVGYAFGVHFSTFLSLLIPATSPSTPLSSKSFVAVWLLSCTVTTFLAGRWKCFALSFSGASGGALFALSLSVIIHPSVLTRVILVAIILPILTLLTTLPLARSQHIALRFASASTGAFGLVISIALLSHIPAWANVWERLWISDSLTWGTTREKGLSAAFCLFLCAGAVCDWILKRKFGECPEQKWDNYLANYAANLPGRAGTFQPLASAWDRLLGSSLHKSAGLSKDIVFPNDEDQKFASPSSGSPLQLRGYDRDDTRSRSSAGEAFEFKRNPEFLKKDKSLGHARLQAKMGRKSREAVKFRPLGEGEFSSDSEDGDGSDFKKSGLGSPGGNVKPWLKQKASVSSTSVTLVDGGSGGGRGVDEMGYQKETGKLKNGMREGEVPEYSDVEEDLTSVSVRKGVRRDSAERWSPGFLKRHQSGSGRGGGGNRVSSTVSHGMTVEPVMQTAGARSPPVGAVPATPSLMKALDRIAVAQKAAFGDIANRKDLEGLGGREGGYESPRWDEFWREVKEKART